MYFLIFLTSVSPQRRTVAPLVTGYFPFLSLLSPSSLHPSTPTAAAAKSLESSPTLRPHRRQPTRLRRPWDSPGKNTGVGSTPTSEF